MGLQRKKSMHLANQLTSTNFLFLHFFLSNDGTSSIRAPCLLVAIEITGGRLRQNEL